MSKRTLKYKIISKSEDAPVVGSVVEEKDTIFVKQITETEFELYASDETGYVVKLDKTIKKEEVDKIISSFLQNKSAMIKNALAFSDDKSFSFGGVTTDIIFHHNEEKIVLTKEKIRSAGRNVVGGVKYSFSSEDRMLMKGEDYPNTYINLGRGTVLGKNITDVVDISHLVQLSIVPIDNSDNVLIEKRNVTVDMEGAPGASITTEFYADLTSSTKALYAKDGKIKLNINGSGRNYVIKNSQQSILYSGPAKYNIEFELNDGETLIIAYA